MALSDFLKTSAIEKNEEYMDLESIEIYEKAVYEKTNKSYTHDEVLKMFNIE